MLVLGLAQDTARSLTRADKDAAPRLCHLQPIPPGYPAQPARPHCNTNFQQVDIRYNLNFRAGTTTRHKASSKTPG